MKLAAILAFLLAAGAPAFAQDPCGVGTRVQFEDGMRGVGTIAEIGTQSPHVGWYRIVFSWAPKGEWFPPKAFGMFVAGTQTRCGGAPAAAAPPAPRPGAAPAAPRAPAAPGAPVARNAPAAPQVAAPAGCPFNEPPGRVTASSRASAQLFQRVIYETAAAKVNPASISAPKRVGITFLAFEMGQPFQNTLTSSRFGDKRLHTGAPVNETVYPVKTRELQCDLHGSQVRRTVSEVDRSCFKSRSGNWTCPGRTLRTIETGLIPVR